MAQDDRLKEYMDLLETLPAGLPGEGTIRKLQRQCDLEPGDLKKLEMLVERHSERADVYLHRDNVIGAIEELERASQLIPRNPFIHLDLARLYKNRYENYGFLRNDREKAKSEAEKTIALDSTLREAADIIGEVDLLHKRLNGRSAGKRPVTLIVLAVSLLFFLLAFSRRETLLNWFRERLDPPEAFAPAMESVRFDPSVPHDVPMNSFGFEENNLAMDLRSSRVRPVNDHWGYELKGGISSYSLAIDRAELELRFLDGDSSLVMMKNITLDEGAPVLPGETLPVNLFFYIPFAPDEVASLSITPVNISLIPEPPIKSRDQTLRWESVKPEGVKLSLEERETSDQEGYDRNIHYYTLDLKHSGTRGIGLLELTFTWRDKDENIVQTLKVKPVRPDEPALEGGEERVITFHRDSPFNMNWKSLYYDAAVTDIELVP